MKVNLQMKLLRQANFISFAVCLRTRFKNEVQHRKQAPFKNEKTKVR